jgi:Flp pilus assembly protein TadG
VSGIRSRTQRGAAAVEFALVVPLLVTFIFGIVWTGLAYADHIAVTNAVREGARYGAAADASAGTTWATSVRSRVQQVYADAESSLPNARICVRLIDSSGAVVTAKDGTQASSMGAQCGSPPGSWPPSMASGTCAVEVWASKHRTISLIVFPDMSLTLGANSIAYYGRTVTGCPATP